MRDGAVAVIIAVLLVAASSSADPILFRFQSEGKMVEGYLQLPSGPLRALVFYFHRSIEDRNAVLEWGRLLVPRGYGVAGYTVTSTTNIVGETKSAITSLRARKDLASTRMIAMGASLGTRAASLLFASTTEVKGLVLIVPTSPDLCRSLEKATGRPVFIIEAEKDEITQLVPGSLLKCSPQNAKHLLLPGASHRFPPSLVASKIADWLDEILREKRSS